MKKQQYIITGIGTEVGKTVVSAIVSEALKASYWKPVQAGDLDNSDSRKIDRWTENVDVLPEAFRLSEPMSPHAAAEIDGITIELDQLVLPSVEGNMIVEGAGGLMVPVNSYGLLYADVFTYWDLPAIVVSRHYLGSINHTLLTIETLKRREVSIKGIIFVGDENPTTESIIKEVAGVPIIARIPIAQKVDKGFVMSQAELLRKTVFHGE